MNILIAGATSEKQYVNALETFYKIRREPNDDVVIAPPGWRGDVARTQICSLFLRQKQYDALLLCDLDQKFPPDTLERLRAHDLDMVSGHYLRRQTGPMQSIWQHTIDGSWPYLPFLDIPDVGLHRLATTGMGCVLIKREVIEAVDNHFPYGSNPFQIGPIPEIKDTHGNFGSDYRFFYYAQMLGYELWGDAEVECPHAITMWLTRDLYNRLDEKNSLEQADWIEDRLFEKSMELHGMNSNALQARLEMLQIQAKDIEEKAEHYTDQMKVISGQIAELTFLLKKDEEGGEIARKKLDTLPTFGSREEAERAYGVRDRAIGGESREEALELRKGVGSKHDVALAREMGRSEDDPNPPRPV